MKSIYEYGNHYFQKRICNVDHTEMGALPLFRNTTQLNTQI